jgi:hypothetical protein
MYFVGNIKNYSKIPHWKTLISAMQQQHRSGDSIPLCCALHDASRCNLPAKDAAQAERLNFCKKSCGQLMGCGIHKCKRPCHGQKLGTHDASLCVEPVDDHCVNGHLIRRKCNVSKEDAFCMTCESIAQAEGEREERLQKEREKEAQRECDRRIDEVQRQPGYWRTDIEQHGANSVEFNQIKDRTEKYVQAGHGICVQVLRIEKIINPELERRFLETKKMLKSGAADCKQQQLFHGTGVEGLEGIPKNGFRVPEWSDGNMFGRGIYFAPDSSKSAQEMYTKGSKALILCDVLLGHVCEVPGLTAQHALSKYVKTSKTGRPFLDVDEKKIRKEGFDSVYAPRDTRANAGVQFDEMIVYNPSQAMPRYVIHFGQVHSNQKWQNDPTCLYGKATVRYIRAEDVGSNISRELDEFNMAVGHFWRLLGSTCTVKRVDVYESPVVQSAYEKKKSEFSTSRKPVEEMWVFHGTSPENIQSICLEGFKVGGQGIAIANGAAFGNGVYTAKGPRTPMGTYGRGKAVILCKALPGKISKIVGEGDSWAPNEDWLIFKTAKQLLPVYVLHF